MTPPNFILLYASNPRLSAAFYETLLGHPPVEATDGFALFKLDNGLMLGLWNRAHVEPAAPLAVGGSELAFGLENKLAVEQTYTLWQGRGMTILQTPTEMDFGFTFTAADPDGHRLRVFAAAST